MFRGWHDPERVTDYDFFHLIDDAVSLDSVVTSDQAQPLVAHRAELPEATRIGLDAATDIAVHFAGPIGGAILKALLARSEKTSKEMHLLLNEPFLTGVAIAQRAIAINPSSEADRERQRADIDRAIELLDTAYTFALNEYSTHAERDSEGKRLYIRLVQGLLAKHTGAKSYADSFLTLPRVAIKRHVVTGLQLGFSGPYHDFRDEIPSIKKRRDDYHAEFAATLLSGSHKEIDQFVKSHRETPLGAITPQEQDAEAELEANATAEFFLKQFPQGIPETFETNRSYTDPSSTVDNSRTYIEDVFAWCAGMESFRCEVFALYGVGGRCGGLERLGLFPGGSGWRKYNGHSWVPT